MVESLLTKVSELMMRAPSCAVQGESLIEPERLADVYGSCVPPSRETVCAVVVTYHPDSGFYGRAARVAAQVARMVIIDNGSSDQKVHWLSEVAGNLSAHLVVNANNEGVAKALNQGALWAAEQGFLWVLTMDQDSVVAPNMVESLCQVYKNFPDSSRLAIIGSNYVRSIGGALFGKCSRGTDGLAEEVKAVITSGSLISLRAFREVGGFRDEFFIDRVDHEYCLRARSHGLKVALARKALMHHPIGNGAVHRLFWKRTGTSNHSPIRRYYMARNQFVLVREYLSREPAWTVSALMSFSKSIILMCLFEKEVATKLKYTVFGVFDGVTLNFQQRRWCEDQASLV